MASPTWEETHRPLLMRICAMIGIVWVVQAFLSLGGPFFDSISSPQILDWAKHHAATITVSGFLEGESAALLTIFILVLVSVAGRGLLATIATCSMAAFLAIDWVQAGAYFALADAGQREQAGAGVVALFSLVKTLTFADGFVVGIAVTALCLLALRSRVLPLPIAVLGLLMGVYHLLEHPIQLIATQTPGGFTGPVGVGLGLVWVLAVSATLLIRPIWNARLESATTAA